MGYTHGIKWTDEKIENSILAVMKDMKLERMPSASEIVAITGNNALSNKVAKSGGYEYWANKLGVSMKQSETNKGNKYEKIIKNQLETMGFEVEMMKAKYPYDLLVNRNIKVDVKVSSICSNEKAGEFHTFNLEKDKPTCDIYVAITLVDKIIERIFIIPSKYLHVTQLSVGLKSKYNKYIDRWDYISIYDTFYKYII